MKKLSSTGSDLLGIQHSAIAFVSKDENLTKAHIRFLENRLIEESTKIGRY